MALLDAIKRNLFNIIILYIIVFFFFSASLFTLYSYGGDVINDNWVDYRCNPLIMPFAGHFGHDTGDNFNKCLGLIFKSHSESVTSPFFDMFDGIFSTIGEFLPVFNNIRQFATKLRILFLSITTTIFERLENVAELVHYVFVKLLDIMRKMQAMFVITLRTLQGVQMTFESMWNGPIGSVSKFLCFHPETPIVLHDGTCKPIQGVQIGDLLQNHNKVLGVIQGFSGDAAFYRYKNITVSGSHLVYENNRFTRIQNAKHAIPIQNSPDVIWCLITQQNTIPCEQVLFSDFIESHDTSLHAIVKSHVLHTLNSTKPTSTDTLDQSLHPYYAIGFHPDTLICMQHNAPQKIKDIQIGDITTYGRVLGTIQQEYLDHWITDAKQTCLCARDTVLKINNIYQMAKETFSTYSNALTSPTIIHHLITDGGHITLANGWVSTDYLECTDEHTNNRIDQLSMDWKNAHLP